MTGAAAKLRVLVVDDSPAMQELMRLVIGQAPECEIVGIAGSAEEGWGLFCKAPPDVVTLDLELPGRPGMDLLKRIMRERPAPVVVVSANGGEGTAATISALEAGAVSFIDKPDGVTTSVEQFAKTLIDTVRSAANASRGIARVAPQLGQAPAPIQPKGPIQEGRLIAIGASTGGVPAIQTVLGGLKNASLPIVIAQHMPPGYTRRFAERLTQVTGIETREAEDGEPLQRGRAYLAPGSMHMQIARSGSGIITRLFDGPPVSGHKPSVDVLFASVAEVMGNRAVGALLTGMGRDGAEGLLAMRRAGAQTLVEAEQTAVVFGMPRAALEMGAAADSFPLSAIAGRIMALIAPAPVMAPRTTPVAASAKPERGQDIRTKPITDIKVLVVDDQASMRGLARLSLNEIGFQKVSEARSGEEALAQTESDPTDLILLDWNMDGLSGLDVLKTLRQKRQDKATVVVMTTSEKNISKVHEATQAGANNYLVKPYNVPQLKARLERALMRHL